MIKPSQQPYIYFALKCFSKQFPQGWQHSFKKKGNLRNYRKKKENTKKSLSDFELADRGNDHLQMLNNNTDVIARMLLILLENFMNIYCNRGGGE